tara:strand:- start:886 stop:1593 length:708 start_codon:yes stop_codon:yes gene_type:complete
MLFRIILLSLAFNSVIAQEKIQYNMMELLGKANPEFYNKKIPMIKEAGEAFVNMQKEALKEGIKIKIVSGFRSFNRQKQIWNRKFRINKMNGLSPKQNLLKIIEYSTLPGTSRHHWGTDIDIIDGNKIVSGDLLLEENFHGDGPYVKLRKWMDINSKRFGFYRPYNNNPKRKGFKYEPWHYSYAPISIPMLKAYLKLKLRDQIVQKDLEGYQHLNHNFLAKYKKEHILGISNNLK